MRDYSLSKVDESFIKPRTKILFNKILKNPSYLHHFLRASKHSNMQSVQENVQDYLLYLSTRSFTEDTPIFKRVKLIWHGCLKARNASILSLPLALQRKMHENFWQKPIDHDSLWSPCDFLCSLFLRNKDLIPHENVAKHFPSSLCSHQQVMQDGPWLLWGSPSVVRCFGQFSINASEHDGWLPACGLCKPAGWIGRGAPHNRRYSVEEKLMNQKVSIFHVNKIKGTRHIDENIFVGSMYKVYI